MNELEIAEFTDDAMMSCHCAPIFFLPSATAPPAGVAANGTIALLDTGQRKILVTCWHVWDEFLAYSQKHPGASLCTVFANGPTWPIVIPAESLIDSEPSLDLAVFVATPESWNMGWKNFFRINCWPVPKARKGDPISFLGFPGALRDTSRGVGDFGAFVLCATVSDVSHRGLVIARAPDSEGHLVDSRGKKLQPLEVGGLSGCPAYVRDAKWRPSLAGFVHMGTKTNADIFLIHAAFLNPDGTITRAN